MSGSKVMFDEPTGLGDKKAGRIDWRLTIFRTIIALYQRNRQKRLSGHPSIWALKLIVIKSSTFLTSFFLGVREVMNYKGTTMNFM